MNGTDVACAGIREKRWQRSLHIICLRFSVYSFCLYCLCSTKVLWQDTVCKNGTIIIKLMFGNVMVVQILACLGINIVTV